MKAQSKTDDRKSKLAVNEDLNEYLKDLAGGEALKRRTIGNMLMEDPVRVGPGHDGHLHVKELSFSGYERNPIFYNTGGKFEDVGGALGAALLDDGRGTVAADFDGDGDDDIALRNAFTPSLVMFRNDVAREPQLVVRLKGTKTNRFGIGARVTIRATGLTQSDWIGCGIGYLSCRPPEAHFGLGARKVAVEVRWPTGEISKAADVAAGVLTFEEGKPEPSFVAAAAVPAPAMPAIHRLLRAGDALAIDAIDLQGKPMAPRTGKAHVIHVWSTSCFSCTDEVQNSAAYVKACADAGIELVSLNLDGPRTVETVEPKDGWKMPMYVLRSGIEAWQPAVDPVLPLHVVVAEDGRIVDRIVGNLDPAELAKLAKAALAQR